MTWIPMRPGTALVPLDDEDITYVVNKLLKYSDDELVRIIKELHHKMNERQSD